MGEQGVGALAAVQRRGTYGYDNRYILDSCDAHPGRFHPVVVLDAEDPAVPAQLLELVRDHRLSGLRLTGMKADQGGYPWLESESALHTWAAAARTGVVIDLMYVPPGYSADALQAILRLAQRFPSVKIVLDHVGWPRQEGAPGYGLTDIHPRLARQPNIHYKFTTINLDLLQEAKIPSQDFVRKAVDVLGAQRILWGSDMGNSPGTYEEMVGRARAATNRLTDRERRQILRDTGRAVFARTAAPLTWLSGSTRTT
jgi:predicted TIM-barrel fold metal-dependent hydrolase